MQSKLSRMLTNYPIIDVVEVNKWMEGPHFGSYKVWRVFFRGPLAQAVRRDDSGQCYVDLPRSMQLVNVAAWLTQNVLDWRGFNSVTLVYIDGDGNEHSTVMFL